MYDRPQTAVVVGKRLLAYGTAGIRTVQGDRGRCVQCAVTGFVLFAMNCAGFHNRQFDNNGNTASPTPARKCVSPFLS